MLTTKSKLKYVRDRIPYALNACRVGYVGLQKDPTGKNTDLRIEMDLDDAGNCFDSKSLDRLLGDLKDQGIVCHDTQTIWFGLNNHEPKSSAAFKIWCAGFKGE